MHIKVKVSTGAKIEKIVKKSDDSFEIKVKEPAERGLANKRVLELLREAFKGYNKIRIISGHHSKSKIISIN
jgi:hypothetical protein